MKQTVTLEDQEWQGLINVLANATNSPWVVTNPLLMKIGQQLQAQTQAQPGGNLANQANPNQGNLVPGNSQDGEQIFRSNTPYTGRRD